MGAVSNDATFNLINGTHLSLLSTSLDTYINFYDPSISRSALLLLFVARARAGVVRTPGPVSMPSPPLLPNKPLVGCLCCFTEQCYVLLIEVYSSTSADRCSYAFYKEVEDFLCFFS